MRCLVWFREHDLRCSDNTALYHACKTPNKGVIALFIISPEEWHAHDFAPRRVDFIMRNVKCLAAELTLINIPLLVLNASSTATIPQLLLQAAQDHQINNLYFNEQYEFDEKIRDERISHLFTSQGMAVSSYTDQVVIKPGEVRTLNNSIFTIFTPFKKAWLKRLEQMGGFVILPKPGTQAKLAIKSDPIPIKISGFNFSLSANDWPAGEKHAQQRLQQFINSSITHYHIDRDFPAINGTSALSPYLTAGVLSPRQCIQSVLDMNNGYIDKGDVGACTWVNELIWREFYKHILDSFPRVSKHRAFKLATEKLPWDNNVELFHAWKNGATGFPIIDAAMRQLLQIGWMHNRLRMIVAMFLSKNLLINWRWGEQYFMQQLIDGDLAANNGGWQWAASTGTDAVPYFRIFNPVTQSKRYDPQGEFIKKYCPELINLDESAVHEPWRLQENDRKQLPYSYPIIDLKESRQRALRAYNTPHQK